MRTKARRTPVVTFCESRGVVCDTRCRLRAREERRRLAVARARATGGMVR